MDFRSVSRGSCGSSPLHTDSELYSPVGQGPFSVDSIQNMSPNYIMENFSMRGPVTASVIWEDACKDFKGADSFDLSSTSYAAKTMMARVAENALHVKREVFEMPDFSDIGEDYEDSPPDFAPSAGLDGNVPSCYKPVAIRVSDSHQSSPQHSPGGSGHFRVVHSLRSEDLCKPEAVAQHVNSILTDTDGTPDDVNYELIESATPYTDATKPKKASKKNHVKRPLNAFMLWAKDERNKMREGNPELHNASISKHLGIVWQGLDRKIKDCYQAKAQQLKLLHEKEYPGYKYQPRKNKNKKAETVTTESGRVSKPTAKAQVESKRAPRPRKSVSGKSRKGKSASAPAQPTEAAFVPSDGMISEEEVATVNSIMQQSQLDQYMQLLQQQQQSMEAIDVAFLPVPIVTAQAISTTAGLSSGLQQHLKITGGMVISHKAEPVTSKTAPIPTVQIIPGPIPVIERQEMGLEPSEYRVVPPFLSNDEVEEFFSIFPQPAVNGSEPLVNSQPLCLKEEPMEMAEPTSYSVGDADNIFTLFPVSEQLPPDIFE